MIDLKKSPFNLSDEDIAWVQKTKSAMTLDEKIGQLFVPIGYNTTPEYLENALLQYHIGGAMYRLGGAKELQETFRYMQTHSKIPLLIGANLEYGGAGIALEGTYFGSQMFVAATGDSEQAYRLGKISCSEGKAVGCNWSFAPVADIDLNYHNPITNTRTYGNNADFVLKCGLAYKRGADEEGVAVAVKHFPGDGVDEVDQHILCSVNSLSCEEWDKTYGKIYKGLIDGGAMTVMAGHIAQPAYEERISGEKKNMLIPATQSPSLLKGLLREKLGFNGVIVTDSTCMVGFGVVKPRCESVPYAIESGCDLFLFNKDLGEDFAYMKAGYESGLLSEKRLDEALTRILGMKASLGLNKKKKTEIVPDSSALEILADKTHKAWAKECADKAVTLVKDTQNALPLSPKKTKKLLLEVLGENPSSERVEKVYKELLEKAGFTVSVYRREDFGNMDFSVETFKSKYDAVLYVGNMQNASNRVTNRYQWYTFFGNGDNCPWFTAEVPVIYISHGNPYALLDAPQIKTYVNAYANHDDAIKAALEKILGRSSFRGVSPIDPFCGKEYLKY